MTTKSQFTAIAGVLFTCIIVTAVFYISKRYILPLSWSALIVISTWPIYQRLYRACGKKSSLSAVIMTICIVTIILIPLSWLVINITHEIITANTLLYTYNKIGIPQPHWIQTIPMYGQQLSQFWQQHLSKPKFMEYGIRYLHLYSATFASYAQTIGKQTLYHTVSIFFSILALFFFFRDAEFITQKLNLSGNAILAQRWQSYCVQLPHAMRSVVNGTIIVGLGVGLLMGLSYAIAGIPLPVLFGFITAVLAMIPFGMIITLTIVVLILLIKSSYIAALVILTWGIIVTFVSDHIVKPNIIGGSTKLPFLMILIGILGGVETLGLIGLFVGPIIMVLFYTLFDELAK